MNVYLDLSDATEEIELGFKIIVIERYYIADIRCQRSGKGFSFIV